MRARFFQRLADLGSGDEFEVRWKGGAEPSWAVLSARRLPVERAKAVGREISRNTWTFIGPGDKIHPHYFCNAADLIALMPAFEMLTLFDRVHDKPGSWHWHLLAEKTG